MRACVAAVNGGSCALAVLHACLSRVGLAAAPCDYGEGFVRELWLSQVHLDHIFGKCPRIFGKKATLTRRDGREMSIIVFVGGGRAYRQLKDNGAIRQSLLYVGLGDASQPSD